MRALVTGGCGFVGYHLMTHLLECGDDVVGSVIDEARIPITLKQKVDFYKLDVTNPTACAELITRLRPEVVYHLAGLSFVPDAENDFTKALLINVGGVANVLQVCHLIGGVKVIVISSGEVYGRISPEDLPLNENLLVKPGNNYSLTKAMAELVTRRYADLGNIKTVIMRPFNHLGPGQEERFVAPSFAKQLALIAAKKHAPEMMVGNLDVKRDFCDVRDVVRSYRLAAIKGSGSYNIGSGRATAIRELLDTLIALSGLKVSVVVDQARVRPAEVPEIRCDISRAKKDLGWEPQVSLSKTLETLYRDWQERVAKS